jgi:hypothetical protein
MTDTIQTSDAVKLLCKATSLRVNNSEVEHWNVIDTDLSHYPDNGVILSLESDNEIYTFKFDFTKQNLLDATVEDNCIFLKDVDNEDCMIGCYTSKPCYLED